MYFITLFIYTGHDLLGALQDNTITEDTTTLCTDKPEKVDKGLQPRRRSLRKRSMPMMKNESQESEDELQFGFENIVFEIDNRCDDQKIREPIRYCSLAQFVEGNDIARRSFKRNSRRKSAPQAMSTTKLSQAAKREENEKEALKAKRNEKSDTEVSDTDTVKPATVPDVKRISFDASCKAEDEDEVCRIRRQNYQRVNQQKNKKKKLKLILNIHLFTEKIS